MTGDVFKRAMALCQDTDYAVRIAMCQQLVPFARCAGMEMTQKQVLPELYELLTDEEVQVSDAAAGALGVGAGGLGQRRWEPWALVVSGLRCHCSKQPLPANRTAGSFVARNNI